MSSTTEHPGQQKTARQKKEDGDFSNADTNNEAIVRAERAAMRLINPAFRDAEWHKKYDAIQDKLAELSKGYK